MKRFACFLAGIDEVALENKRLFPTRPLDFVVGLIIDLLGVS